MSVWVECPTCHGHHTVDKKIVEETGSRIVECHSCKRDRATKLGVILR